jgi:hypothetical protein
VSRESPASKATYSRRSTSRRGSAITSRTASRQRARCAVRPLACPQLRRFCLSNLSHALTGASGHDCGWRLPHAARVGPTLAIPERRIPAAVCWRISHTHCAEIRVITPCGVRCTPLWTLWHYHDTRVFDVRECPSRSVCRSPMPITKARVMRGL